MTRRRIPHQSLKGGAMAAQKLWWQTMALDRKQAEDCLKVLLDMDQGLRDSEIKWIDIIDKSKRPFSKKFVGIVMDIYDRRCR